MLDALLLFYVIDVPFLTAPVSKPDFPIALEHLRDSSDTPLATNTYSWASPTEIRANLQMGPSDFQPSRLILDGDGNIQEERIYYENSDSLFFIERYEYLDGKLRRWKGISEAAECFYRDGLLDSIHMRYSHEGVDEEYYFKLRYDSVGNLAEADRIMLVQDNNPDDDKRITMTREDGGLITVRSYILPSTSDPRIEKVFLQDGRLHEIHSATKSNPTRFSNIDRFTYPGPLGIPVKQLRTKSLQHARLQGKDLLGRSIARQKAFPREMQPRPAPR